MQQNCVVQKYIISITVMRDKKDQNCNILKNI